MTLPLGKHSGRHAFALACAEAGIQIEGDELNEAFKRFKQLADQRKQVTLYDVFEREAAVPREPVATRSPALPATESALS